MPGSPVSAVSPASCAKGSHIPIGQSARSVPNGAPKRVACSKPFSWIVLVRMVRKRPSRSYVIGTRSGQIANRRQVEEHEGGEDRQRAVVERRATETHAAPTGLAEAAEPVLLLPAITVSEPLFV